MNKSHFTVALTRAELGTILGEHRHLRVLLGKLECSRHVEERRSLLMTLDDAFDSHGQRELEILRKTAAEDPSPFIESDRREHFAMEDLLVQLNNLQLSSNIFRGKVSVIRQHMTAHMADEERYLRLRMDPPLHRNAHAQPLSI